MATWTNNGLILVATAIQTNGAKAGIIFVDIGTGCGTLASALTSGSNYTTIIINNPGIPAAVTSGQQLEITDGVNVQLVTVATPGALANANLIPVMSFNPAHNFATNTTGVAPIPQATDTALYGGSAAVRVVANQGVAGANPGESLSSGYFDGTQPTGVYMLVGYFGGSTATSTPGSGTLMGADVQYWNHVQNNDSNMFQADNTI